MKLVSALFILLSGLTALAIDPAALDAVMLKGLPGGCSIANLGRTYPNMEPSHKDIFGLYEIVAKNPRNMPDRVSLKISKQANAVSITTKDEYSVVDLIYFADCKNFSEGGSCLGNSDVKQFRIEIKSGHVFSIKGWEGASVPPSFEDSDLSLTLNCETIPSAAI